jgi:uncharacterized membrane protein YkoI
VSKFRFPKLSDRIVARRTALLGVALLGAAGPALAQVVPAPAAGPDANDEPTAIATQQINPRGGISLAQATAIAQGRYQGRVVRAAQFMQGDRVVYEIRILGNDGTVRTVLVDGQTGAIL